jgi:hypothetical protein
MKIMKKTAILFAAVILVSAVMAVTVFAQPLWQGIGKEKGYARSFVEHGFALNGTEYHILDVNVRTHKGNNTQSTATGNLRFGGQVYALNVTSYDNQSLSGDVMTLPPRGTNKTGFTPTTLGHISLSTSKYEGEMLSTGTLRMNNTIYNVLLTSPVVTSEAGPHNFKGGSGPQNFNGTLRPHNFNGTVEPRNFNGVLRPHNTKR